MADIAENVDVVGLDLGGRRGRRRFGAAGAGAGVCAGACCCACATSALAISATVMAAKLIRNIVGFSLI